MKYWYDTEFVEDGTAIDLVSIGIVAEDNRELYLVSSEFDQAKLKANPWLVKNVWPSLPTFRHPSSSRCACGIGHLDVEHPAVRTRGQIARAVREFLLASDDSDDPIQLWSWYSSYDDVALKQLFGTMAMLPTGIPWRTNDIEQDAERLGVVDQLPKPPEGQHNALVDAHYHRRLHEFVEQKAAEQLAALKQSWSVTVE